MVDAGEKFHGVAQPGEYEQLSRFDLSKIQGRLKVTYLKEIQVRKKSSKNNYRKQKKII